MKLRKLRKDDAPLMLEWMRDPDVTRWFGKDFMGMTREDCERFIERASEQAADLDSATDLHLAVADEADEYLGTVSLKHIDRKVGCAEFAIVLRPDASGNGVGSWALNEMVRVGLEDLGLRMVYWSVRPENARAIHVYKKNGYRETTAEELEGMGIKLTGGGYSLDQVSALDWFTT